MPLRPSVGGAEHAVEEMKEVCSRGGTCVPGVDGRGGAGVCMDTKLDPWTRAESAPNLSSTWVNTAMRADR